MSQGIVSYIGGGTVYCFVQTKMEDIDNIEEDECGFSRNYFLAKELGGASKRSAHKLSDIHIVDEQVILDILSQIMLYS